MAMNGWGAADPAWWLNLQEHPEAIAQTRDLSRQVRARGAQGDDLVVLDAKLKKSKAAVTERGSHLMEADIRRQNSGADASASDGSQD